MKKYRLFFIFITFFLTVSGSLDAAVNQRIAVLKFRIIGQSQKYFLPAYIQKVFERELDRTGSLNVVREYLWSRAYNGQPDQKDLKSIMDFGLQAKVEAVVYGEIDARNLKDIVIEWTVHDILNNKTILTKRIQSDDSDKLFDRTGEAIVGSVKILADLLPPIDPRVVVKQRIETRKVYVSSSLSDFEIGIYGGVASCQPNVSLPGFSLTSGTQVNNMNVKENVVAFKAGVNIRIRRFSFEPDFFFSISPQASYRLLSCMCMYWIVPDTVALGITPQFFMLSSDVTALKKDSDVSVPVSLRSYAGYFQCSVRFKPKNLSFGLSMAIPWAFISNSTYGGIDRTLSIDFSNINIYYEIPFSSKFSIRMDMIFNNFKGQIENDSSLNIGPMSIALSGCYRFGWSVKK